MDPDFAETLAAWRRPLHAHPGLTLQEGETARFVATRLREIGISEIVEGVGGHGLVATIRRGGTLTDADHHLLALWAAACAEHVLHLFEEVRPGDLRLWRARKRYGLPVTKSHDALGDALACAELYLAQTAELGVSGPLLLRDVRRREPWPDRVRSWWRRRR